MALAFVIFSVIIRCFSRDISLDSSKAIRSVMRPILPNKSPEDILPHRPIRRTAFKSAEYRHFHPTVTGETDPLDGLADCLGLSNVIQPQTGDFSSSRPS
jgi:hypothetical protein